MAFGLCLDEKSPSSGAASPGPPQLTRLTWLTRRQLGELWVSAGRIFVVLYCQEACTASLQHANTIFDDISQDRLQMELVCTDPDFQRHGAASKLVQWGMNRAIAEKVNIISVAASSCGQILYQKHKFSVIRRNVIQ
ncbi:MAG: hypothetical protein M1813_002857 [Trichoglossum hirsutum]|nr:MAG: hypothetical protein M1813_002857 [Trichoglossum hirsutum]